MPQLNIPTASSTSVQTHRAARPRQTRVPEIFVGIRTQVITPSDVSRAQKTFNEEALYGAIEAGAKAWHRQERRPARVLEFCSSSGLCALRVSRVIDVESVTLVDIDPDPLAVARRRFRSSPRVSTVLADAVTYRAPHMFDVILLNSAYHHIANRSKARFLANVARHLAPGGRVLLGDHFLAPYQRPNDFRAAVVAFYAPLLGELTRRHTHARAVEIIRQAAYQCWNREVEFKVSWPVFQRHLVGSGLRLRDYRVVWSPTRNVSPDVVIGSVSGILSRE
jgi:SAM-dependent methyltransferase